MPPKAKIKKKISKAFNEPEYKLLTMQEMKAKELKYSSRLMDLRKCISFIDDALTADYSLNQQQLLQSKWIHFLSCNPLPKPDLPPDIRRFYSKLKYMEKENEKNLNWLLLVNEKSILSQDIHRQDLTRRRLNVTQRENMGEEYNNYIRDSVEILERIDNFLENDAEVAKCSVNRLDDIVKHKLVIENEIMDLINRFTYRVISSEDAEMKSIDAISAEYFFNALDFDLHIWCFKNVAIRFSHLREPRQLAYFHSMNLLLQIPLHMLKDNLVIRALHMKFDHLTEKTKSFKGSIPASTENPYAGILDLHDCLVNEWYLQKKMQTEALHNIKQKRLEYEEKIRQYEEQLEKRTERKAGNKTKKKIKKIVKPKNEPLAIGSDMVPDIYEEFLQEEQKQYENFIETIYKPELNNLSLDQINLKKFLILGGIYQLQFVEKPRHINLNSFNMTWHENESKLKIEKNVKILAGSWLSSQSQILTYRRFTKRMTVFEIESRISDPNLECPWFIVTIELPEYLCYWGEPIACHFEETITKDEELQSTEIVETKNILKKTEETKGSLINLKPKLESDSFTREQEDLVSQDNFSFQRKRLATSQQMTRETFFQESLVNSLLNKRQAELLSRTSLESLCVNDFSLLKTLTKPQIRHIERHIIPRIISSYKFPKEVQHEELQIFNKKPKAKGGRIIQPKTDDIPYKLSGRQFTFTERQNNPERIFANYPKVASLHILSYLRDHNLIDNQKEPETFVELLQVVEDIKKKYCLLKNKTLDLKALDQQIVTRNKKIKQMLRNKKLPSTRTASTTASPIIKRSLLKSSKIDTEYLKPGDNEKNGADNLSDLQTDLLVEDNLLTEKRSSETFDTKQSKKEFEKQIHPHWTTKYILKSEFDRKTRKIVLHTDRLGNFGFAFKRYEHFPFKYWSMEPNVNDPDNEVIFTLDTQHVKCVLYITANGIRGHVMELSKSNVRNPKMFLVIDSPIKYFKEFKKLLKEKHLNIFAEYDAGFYIENGYYSEKHLSNELHTYNCMSVHSTQMNFNFSLWNRLAKRRDIILKFKQYQDLEENLVEVRITPGEAFFVEIEELCSDWDVIKLDYNLTWRNIESYSDLHHAIVSMYPSATDLRCKNPKLICFIRDLLSEVRPLSFS